MKKIFTACITFIITGSNALAFDTSTHAAMTAEAAAQSMLGRNPQASPLLQQLGLIDFDGVFGNRYVGFGDPLRSRFVTSFEEQIFKDVRIAISTLPKDQTITGWLMRGAVREDDNTIETPQINLVDNDPTPVFNRVFGHFHDPVNDRGVLTNEGGVTSGLRRGPRARDWALDSAARVPSGASGGNENYYRIGYAREAMWRALTFRQIMPNGSQQELSTVSGNPSATAKENDRKAYWATTLRTLGDMLHLVQDMAQPQHVRDDRHSGLGCMNFNPLTQETGCIAGHASFAENYFRARTVGERRFTLDESPTSTRPVPGSGREVIVSRPNQLKYDGYAPPRFTDYREYFASTSGTNTEGRGLANYTNRGFYSFGTNINDTSFPSPPQTGAGLGTETVSGTDLKNAAGLQICCALRLRTGNVPDTVTGSTDSSRLSTEGAWDQFLQQYGGNQPKYSLNYYNYDDQARLLIPRAVAYSAGLIDYFFRGQLDITPPNEGVYSLVDHYDFSGEGKTPTDAAAGFKGFKTIKLKLRNTTPDITPSGGGATAPQIMPGGTLVAVLKFHRNLRYTDDLSGDPRGNLAAAVDAYRTGRSLNEEIVVNTSVKDGNGNALTGLIPVTNTAQTYIFEFSQELPINATDVKLQVVYRGMLGSEADAVVVQTVDISEPTYFAYMNATDYIKIGESVYTRAQINAATADGAALRSKIRPTQCINTNTNQLIDSPDCMAPTPINFPLYWNTIAPGQIGTIGLDEVGTYHRIATLNPPASTADYYLGASSCLPGDPAIVPSRTVQTNYVPDPAGSGGVIPTVTVDYVPQATRGVNGWYTTSCINNGDGSVPGVGTDDRETKMTPLTGANLKPLQMRQFKFGAP